MLSVPVLPESFQNTAVITANADGDEISDGTLLYKKYADHIEVSGVTDKDTITEANIPAEIDGLPVTTIGDKAFFYCSSLTSVSIPDSVTSIGEWAFSGCRGLTSVSIPDSVTSIGNLAFYACSNLTSVNYFPDSVASIGSGAFSYTPWLTAKREENPLVIVNNFLIDGSTCEGEITIPDTVTNITAGIFSNPNLTAIEVSENNADYTSIDGVLFNKDKTELISYPAGSPRTEYIVPASVTSIKYSAFCLWGEESSLVSIIIENPDCILNDDFVMGEDTTGKISGRFFHGTIYGYENSTAQAYAEKHNLKFALIGSAPETSETESQSEEYQQGDADGNQKIDILDVITLNKATMGKETLSENSLKAIDFNQNGKPDSEESLTLLKYIVGLITDLTA